MLNLSKSWSFGKNQMLEAEEDAIGGACECEENEILVGSEGAFSKIEMDHPCRDVDASYLPPFSDDVALLILARLPISKYGDLRLVSRRFRSLIKNGEFHAIRKKIGLKAPKLFLHLGEARYQCYEPYTRSSWDLPECPYDETATHHARALFCAGTHLLVLGRVSGNVDLWSDSDIWRYELELNRWFNGPMIITPRFYFASADCGSAACIAGGKEQNTQEVLNSAEKYNPESKSWESLPSMNMRRGCCEGFYMDSKFYVIGGQNENRDTLTCGECYDFERNVWELIPNMIESLSTTPDSPRPPYRVAVVNNELYYLDNPSRHLKVYLKNSNTWKKVGGLPASTELSGCQGMRLKSLGNELLLIGRMPRRCSSSAINVCFCTPSPESDNVEWHVLDFNHQGRYPSIYSCCLMLA